MLSVGLLIRQLPYLAPTLSITPSLLADLRCRLQGVAVLALLSLASCAFPTDKSSAVLVTLEAPRTVISRGATLQLTAHAWQRTAAGDLSKLRGVTFRWLSDHPAVAAVVTKDDSSGIVTGLDTGRVEIRAFPADFEDAQSESLLVRITNNPVEIDSITPDTVRYGQQITVYGVGIEAIDRLTLGGANLIPDSSSFVGDSAGVARQRYWVPYPATTDRPLVVNPEFSAPAKDTTVVLPENVYHSGDDSPAFIDLNSPPIGPSKLLFYNPALFRGGRSTPYRFIRRDNTRPLTVVISTTPYPTAASISSPGGGPGSSTWRVAAFFGGQDLTCREQFFFVPDSTTVALDSLVFAFQSLPDTIFELSVGGFGFIETFGYGLRIVEGYEVQHQRITADRFEENDHCQGADFNFAEDPIILTDPFQDTLTIDNPRDVDWLRFRVQGNGSQPVTIRTAARPFDAVDSSDITLAVAASSPGAFGEWLAESNTVGSGEQLSIALQPDDYYLVVSDKVGVPTRYSLCISVGDTCSLPGTLPQSHTVQRSPGQSWQTSDVASSSH
jgi:hypothetical protein